MFFLCYSFAYRVETYNVKLSLMFGLKKFEVYKRIFVYIPMDLKNIMFTLFQYHFKTTLLLSINYIVYRWYHNMLVAT